MKALKRGLAFILAVALTVGTVSVQTVQASEVAEESEETLKTELSDSAVEEGQELEDSDAEEADSDEAEKLTEDQENTDAPEEEQQENKEETAAEDQETAETTEETEEETEETISLDDIALNYLVVDKPYVETGDTQNVVISLGNGEAAVEFAILKYHRESDGQTYEVSAAQISEEGVRFELSYAEGGQDGVYVLDSVLYGIGEEQKEIDFQEIGITASYGVNVETETEADGELVDESQTETVDVDVVTFDEDGNQTSETSIEDAIQDQTPKTSKLKSLFAAAAASTETESSDVKVVLDPGHDSTHGGTSGSGLQEADLTLKIANYCKEELEQYQGVKVYMTREESSCPYPGTTSVEDNKKRVEYAKNIGADVYVSIHLNSGDSRAKGAEVYYPNANYDSGWISAQGKELASSILSQLTALGLSNRGTKIRNSEDGTTYEDGTEADYYGVIRRCKEAGIPGIIVEHAFLSNSSDVSNYLNSEEKLKKLGVADATGIANYFGLSKEVKFEFKQAEVQPSTVTYQTKANLNLTMSKDAKVTVDVYNGDNSYIKNLVKDVAVGTGSKTFTWDLMGTSDYVDNGTYRFTITATAADGTVLTKHLWFKVSGTKPVFKQVTLGADTVNVGTNGSLQCSVYRAATVKIDIYDGKDAFLKTLVSGASVGTETQTFQWDLKGTDGEYVESGTYRYTLTAVTSAGEEETVHRWFKVTGNDPFAFKWTILDSASVSVGDASKFYYAVNRNATVTVDIYKGDNSLLMNLVSEKQVGTNDQVITWDLKNENGKYVTNGTYRYTITATDAKGNTVTVHKWFTVKGNDPVSFKWTILGNASVSVGDSAQLYYAVSRGAKVTVDVYKGDNSYFMNLISNRSVGTNDQVAAWDLKGNDGEYVANGIYRFTIKAVDENGNTVYAHKWFTVKGNDPVSFKWVTLGNSTVSIGTQAQLYYGVSRNARVTVEVYYGNNSLLRTLVVNRTVGTNDQVVTWDLTDTDGDYVENGIYRFTIKAVDDKGNTVYAHRWFTVNGNVDFAYKWMLMGSSTVSTDGSADLYYATNRNAKVTVDIYYGNNSFMKSLFTNKSIGTNDQVASWDLKDASGNTVTAGTYRFTVTATDRKGNKIVSHQYFTVKSALHAIMGDSETTISQMVAYYNSRAQYPAYYAESDAPTIEDFCRIYFEESGYEGVKAEVAFCQAMLETGFLQFGGTVDISQYNFAGLGATGNGVSGESFSDVRTGIRAQVQHLKAYGSTDTLKNACVDRRFGFVKRGCAVYVEWLGKKENPSGLGWATSANYGYNIVNLYMNKLATY